MNNNAVLMALMMAAASLFVVHSYVQTQEQGARQKFGTEVQVLKAKVDIPEAATLNETLFEVATIPKKLAEPSAILFESEGEKQQYEQIRALKGMVAVVPIRLGEQITYNKVQAPGPRTGLAPQITPGKRAVSVVVTDESGVSRLVKPGDRVDIIAILEAGTGKENKVARTLLQDVLVLSTGQKVANNPARLVEVDQATGREKIKNLSSDTSFSTITLEVDALQAQSVALLSVIGDRSVYLSLRNSDDSDRLQVGPTGYGELLGADVSRISRGLGSQKK